MIAAMFAAAVYACTLSGTYIYDDVQVIQLDPRVAQPALWRYFWTRDYMIGAPDKLYRPLTSMSFAIQWWLHGDRAWAFHLVNILLHAGVTALVAVLGARIAGIRVAWIAGLLFAVHPIHVEAVAGLVGRAETLCTLAMLGGLCIFLQNNLTVIRVVAIAGCFLVALLSKEQGMLFPLILLAAVPLRRQLKQPTPSRTTIRWLTVQLLWLMAGYIVWRESTVRFWWDRASLDWEFNPLVNSIGLDRVLMPIVLLGHYAALLVIPVRLSIDYGAMVIGSKVNYSDPYFYAGIAAALLWVVLIVAAWRKRYWPLLFCLLGFAIAYGMVGNIIALIGTSMGERLMYLPSVFLVLSVAMLLSQLPRTALTLVVAIIVLLGAMRSFTYARRWNDRQQFYQWSIENQPRSVRLYALLWNEYASRGDWAGAAGVAARCRAAAPECWEAYVMSAEPMLEMGDYAGARSAVDEGLRHAPCMELRMLRGAVDNKILQTQEHSHPTTRGSSG
jgi:hypothetical protein